jgi:hypothetical protein
MEHRKRKPSPVNGVILPAGFEAHPERRNNGSWKKEDTARYKLEKMMKMTEVEIVAIANDPNAPLFERRIARSLLKENEWKTTEAVINQVYGTPKQRIEVEPVQPKPLIDLTEQKEAQ